MVNVPLPLPFFPLSLMIFPFEFVICWQQTSPSITPQLFHQFDSACEREAARFMGVTPQYSSVQSFLCLLRRRREEGDGGEEEETKNKNEDETRYRLKHQTSISLNSRCTELQDLHCKANCSVLLPRATLKDTSSGLQRCNRTDWIEAAIGSGAPD